MTKLGYFLFNVVLIILVYLPVYFAAAARQHDTLMYTLEFFSGPYIAANFLMALYSLFHWFIKQDHDVANEGVLFLNATWVSALLTFMVYELISHGGFAKIF